jgi:hypothetical protein
LDRRDAQYKYAQQIHKWFTKREAALPDEIAERVSGFRAATGPDPSERGAVWRYLVTDQPFGSWTERVIADFAGSCGLEE